MKLDSRQIINASILLLAAFVLALAGVAGWQSWQNYRVSRDVTLANNIADQLADVASAEDLERGITALALGNSGATPAYLLQRVAEQRKHAEEMWERAANLAASFAERLPDSILAEKLAQAITAHSEVVAARKLVDDCLANHPCQINAHKWIAISSHFIGNAALLRESAFLSLDTPQHIAQFNVGVKRWLWLVNEYATRERGILAYYISARKPIPIQQLDELKSFRGVVDRNMEDILTMKEMRHTDTRILSAIGRMEHIFMGEYEDHRKQAYQSAIKGDYPVDALRWMQMATPAINAVAEVIAAVTAVADEQAEMSMRASRNSLVWHSLLITITLIITFVSIRRVRETTNLLFHQKELAEVTLSSIGDAVITTDAQARVVYLNPVAERVTGWSVAEAQGLPLSEVFNIVNGLTHESIPSPIEKCLQENCVVGITYNTVLLSRTGEKTYIEDSAAPIRDHEGNVVGGVLVFYDVTQSRHANQLLSYHASHDALTGLINRREFERRLFELIAKQNDSNEQHAILNIDVDQFKIINDTHGHVVGDKLIYEIAHLLAEKIRDTDCLARIGGDEFGLLLEHCPLDQALRIAETLRQEIANYRFVWDQQHLEVHASIGLVPFDNNNVTPATLLSEADAACFVAKDKGRNRIQVYQSDDMEMAKRHGEMQWVPRITQALAESRFALFCQPIVPFGGKGRHSEVLLRLVDESGKLISPGEFIPAAERYNLMPSVDRWVISTALQAIGKYLAGAKSTSEQWAINLSGASLCEDDIESYIRQQLRTHNVPPQAICFEVTETAAVANLSDARELIKSLKADGSCFALDDFGSGLSSFMYLKSLPVDYLKIDGSFVRVMVEDSVAHAMVQAINTVGHTMGILTIAEYVENESILDSLRVMGVDYAQGYALGKPIPLADYLTPSLN